MSESNSTSFSQESKKALLADSPRDGNPDRVPPRLRDPRFPANLVFAVVKGSSRHNKPRRSPGPLLARVHSVLQLLSSDI